jgi:hypothetical protein
MDVTLAYPDQPTNFQACLSHHLETEFAYIQPFHLSELVDADAAGWLNNHWLEKIS